MASLTISLPDSLKQFVEAQVAEKRFGDASAFVRALLREAQAKAADVRLEALLLEGLASERLPLDDGFRLRLAARSDQIVDKHKSRDAP